MRASHLFVFVALIAVGCRTYDDEPRLIKKPSVEIPSDATAADSRVCCFADCQWANAPTPLGVGFFNPTLALLKFAG